MPSDRNLFTRQELIDQIKNCGQSIIDNAETILGDERYFLRVGVSFDILRIKAQVPTVKIEREFTPEKEIEDELTYNELKKKRNIERGNIWK